MHSLQTCSFKGVGRKIFREGPIRIEPILTTKNGRSFEIWKVLERKRENPGWAMALPCPPLPTPMCSFLYLLLTFPNSLASVSANSLIDHG